VAKNGSSKHSWRKRAAVNCALFGSLAAGVVLLQNLVFDQHRPKAKDLAKDAAAGCATAVVVPKLNNFIKKKGFNLEP